PDRHSPTLFPYTTLFRSVLKVVAEDEVDEAAQFRGQYRVGEAPQPGRELCAQLRQFGRQAELLGENAHDLGTQFAVDGNEFVRRSEEHTSELQSRENLVC